MTYSRLDHGPFYNPADNGFRFALTFDYIMVQEETYENAEVALLPVVRSSATADKLIALRELALNWVLGVKPFRAINNDSSAAAITPPVDLAAGLISTLTDLISAVMNDQGSAVDYAALRESDIYTRYRADYMAVLKEFDPRTLPSHEAARAFWINLYNALVFDAVIHFEIEDSVIEGRLGTLSFFRRAAYIVGGRRVSLEDIEQGILRGNRGNPYVPGVHFTSVDPRLAWSLPLDPRIHFALNCGGRSCPPIRVYSADDLDRQLDLAARSFIAATVEVSAERQELVMSTILRWYAADFSSREDLLRYLIAYLPDDRRRKQLIASAETIRFAYKPYDWRLNTL